jgi:hypothetical protein
LSAIVTQVQAVRVEPTLVEFTWQCESNHALWGKAWAFDVEWTKEQGAYSEDFDTYVRRLPPVSYTAYTEALVGREGFDPASPEAEAALALVPKGGVEFGSLRVTGLSPLSFYRFRVTPLFSRGEGAYSEPLTVQTSVDEPPYWELLRTRRAPGPMTLGRGAAFAVLDRPHLTPGVEIRDERVSEVSVLFALLSLCFCFASCLTRTLFFWFGCSLIFLTDLSDCIVVSRISIVPPMRPQRTIQGYPADDEGRLSR